MESCESPVNPRSTSDMFFSTRVQENWCKILAVWNHFISEHLEFMVRPGNWVLLTFVLFCFAWACGMVRKLHKVGGHCQPHVLMSAIFAAIWP